MSNSHPFKKPNSQHHIHIFREDLLEYRVCTLSDTWNWQTFLQDGITEHAILGFVSIIKSSCGRPPTIKLFTSQALVSWNFSTFIPLILQTLIPMKNLHSLIPSFLFVFSFFFMNQSVSAETESINQELASLVQEADDFLVETQALTLAEIHHDFSWNFGNLSFVTFVALFSLTCLVLISFQYVISERNRKPANR